MLQSFRQATSLIKRIQNFDKHWSLHSALRTHFTLMIPLQNDNLLSLKRLVCHLNASTIQWSWLILIFIHKSWHFSLESINISHLCIWERLGFAYECFHALPISNTGKLKEKSSTKTKLVLQQILQNRPDRKHLNKNLNDDSRMVYKYASQDGEQEIVPPSYDFEDIDSRAIPYEKRENHEYYEDYAANDLREKGLYGIPSKDRGLSRNRHKEFEAMNQQLQQSPGQKSGQSQTQFRPFSQGGSSKTGIESNSGHNTFQKSGNQVQEQSNHHAQLPKSQSRELCETECVVPAILAVLHALLFCFHMPT